MGQSPKSFFDTLSYAYGKTVRGGVANKSTTHNELIITNKRIIQSAVSGGVGNESIRNRDISLECINGVDVSYGKQSRPGRLFLMRIFFMSGAAFMIMSPIVGIVCLALGVLFLILFAVLKDYSLSFVITGNEYTYSVFAIGTHTKRRTIGRAKGGSQEVVSIKVDKEIARAMAEELGAVIRDALATKTAN